MASSSTDHTTEIAGAAPKLAGPRANAAFGGLSTLGGLGSAVGLGACCALPAALGSVGLGSAWLGSVAVLAAPYLGWLMPMAIVFLAIGALLLWRQQRFVATRGAQAAGSPVLVRLLTLAGIVMGIGLLIWQKYYLG